ncbi:hypothetical protein GIB67_032681 [Kingdonia uniflora]|uniref:Bulb-type lectin domain-containing protein n=1 Tax=Kingdonia uniflora TaxID=39325 RepID=A0A7J7MW44_9MAGN|nr:hypothetical protein GIB67_032681 [Kingdonia uniflora]
MISSATDTLTPKQFITHNQTLISSSEFFELGFFTPSNSNNSYLGIWYKNIPVHTVAWVANRGNPLNDESGILKFDKSNLVAQLLDSGNLVLKYEQNNDLKSFLWQSFDYPSDTLLEDMKLGWDLRIGLDRHLTSWKSPSDPTPSSYTYKMDIRGSPQLVLHNGSVEQFRSGLWNGLRFTGTPELNKNPVFKPIFVSNDEEVYYAFEHSNYSDISRLVLGPAGLLQRIAWNHRSL